MGRLVSVLLVVGVLVGCGRSFVEADAIHKDELSKLKALERACAAKKEEVAKGLRTDALAKRFSETERRKALIQEWISKHVAPEVDKWLVAYDTAEYQNKDQRNWPEFLKAEYSRWLEGTIDFAISRDDASKYDPSMVIRSKRLEHRFDIIDDEQFDRAFRNAEAESAKLSEAVVEFAESFGELPPPTPSRQSLQKAVAAVDEEFEPQIAAQRMRVERAEVEKEAAK